MTTTDFLTPSGVQIRQSPDVPNFTSDAIALANFVTCKRTDTVIDIGCGTGVISLIIGANHNPAHIIAVDIDPHATKLTAENFALNNMTNTQTHTADIREFHKFPFVGRGGTRKASDGVGSFSNTADVIVCNPPYFTTGQQSPSRARAIARRVPQYAK